MSWFELTTKGPVELQSGTAEENYQLNVTDVREDRYFFCQASNCRSVQVGHKIKFKTLYKANHITFQLLICINISTKIYTLSESVLQSSFQSNLN